MSNYTQITDFSVKDGLSSGDPEKIATGADIDAELAAIATAVNSKLDASGGTDLAVADGGTGASTAADARTNLGLGTMSTQAASAVAITGGTIDGITQLTVVSTDAGANVAPAITLDRNSATPAASDNIGQAVYRGRDSGGNATDYASAYGKIVDPTNGSEDGQLIVQTIVAGASADRVTIGQGIQVGSPTGGDKGSGTGNFAGNIYVNDVVVASRVTSTFTPTVTLVGGAGNTVPVYTDNEGFYERIGNIVFVDVRLAGDGGAEGAGTGQVTIALPIAASASVLTGTFPCGRGVNGATDSILLGSIAGGASVISIFYKDAIATTATYAGDNQNNTSRSIALKFWYNV